jgi:ADP-ribose pyrophosphatase YjhB (NUDIX family)
MLITSRETGRWIIPKGWPKKRQAPHLSAAREALEEAGVVGEISRDSIGSYSYRKRLRNGAVVACEVRVFSLEVKRQQKKWPEKRERAFQWFSPTDAAKVVQEPVLREIIRAFPRRKRIDGNGRVPSACRVVGAKPVMSRVRWAKLRAWPGKGRSIPLRLAPTDEPKCRGRQLKRPTVGKLKTSQRQIIGYVGDALVILVIVLGGMYILSSPEKVDAFLNWMLGRN